MWRGEARKVEKAIGFLVHVGCLICDFVFVWRIPSMITVSLGLGHAL